MLQTWMNLIDSETASYKKTKLSSKTSSKMTTYMRHGEYIQTESRTLVSRGWENEEF